MSASKCIHCGARVVLHNMAMGPTWYHQPAGSAFMDNADRYCRTTVAQPFPADDTTAPGAPDGCYCTGSGIHPQCPTHAKEWLDKIQNSVNPPKGKDA